MVWHMRVSTRLLEVTWLECMCVFVSRGTLSACICVRGNNMYVCVCMCVCVCVCVCILMSWGTCTHVVHATLNTKTFCRWGSDVMYSRTILKVSQDLELNIIYHLMNKSEVLIQEILYKSINILKVSIHKYFKELIGSLIISHYLSSTYMICLNSCIVFIHEYLLHVINMYIRS